MQGRSDVLAGGTPQRVQFASRDTDTVEMMVELLRALGYEASGFTEGEKAYWAARQRPPDIVITSLLLSDCSANELAICFKRDPITKHAVFVAFTGRWEDNDAPIFDSFTFVLRKPTSLEELTTLLNELKPGGNEENDLN